MSEIKFVIENLTVMCEELDQARITIVRLRNALQQCSEQCYMAQVKKIVRESLDEQNKEAK